MINEKQIQSLEEKIRQRDKLNGEIREEFLVAIEAIESSEEKIKEILGSDFINNWTRSKITLKELGGATFYSNLEALKSLMKLIDYSEFLKAKNEQV